ncbi:MAG: hypothetical protein ACREOB_00995, partial [Thermodesulfobacteriota bacterium]
MKVRDILRIAVLKTNSCWLFSSLNKMPYYLAIKVFVQMCKRFPEIKSVYLRHRLVEGSWTPALSDIDLAVITDSELSTDEEFYFLRSFWENCDRMKKLFPMLGEIEILNDKHIELWTKFGIEGYISGSWMLLYGKVTVKNNFFVSPKRLAIESLNYALGFYLGLFLIKFNQRDEPLYLVLQDLKRLVFKVQRCLDYININESKKPIVAGLLDNKTDMLFCILNGLEQGIRFIIPANNEA